MTEEEFNRKARTLLDKVSSIKLYGKNGHKELQECFNEYKIICEERCNLKSWDIHEIYGDTFNDFEIRITKRSNLRPAYMIVQSNLSRMLGLT